MKMTTRGRITIPKHLLEQCGLKPGDEVEFIALEDGIRVQKRAHSVQRMRGMLASGDVQTVDEYIDDVRGPVELRNCRSPKELTANDS